MCIKQGPNNKKEDIQVFLVTVYYIYVGMGYECVMKGMYMCVCLDNRTNSRS